MMKKPVIILVYILVLLFPNYAFSPCTRIKNIICLKPSLVIDLKYTSIIKKAALFHNIKPELIIAIIAVESNFNRKAVSNAGAKGLMQLMPCIIKEYKVNNPFNPYENIFAGTKLLSDLLKKYNGNLEKTLAAYNAGEGAVRKYKGIPPFAETKAYIVKVTKNYNKAVNSD